jgi:hypothetical protein
MVSTLYTELEVSSTASGKTREIWQGGVGSVLFVDRRWNDLLPSTLLDMCSFWESEVSPLLAECLQEDGQTVSRENVLEAITPERFLRYVARAHLPRLTISAFARATNYRYLDHTVVELSLGS